MAKGIWASRKPKSNNQRRGQNIEQGALMKGQPVPQDVLETLDYAKPAKAPTTVVDPTTDTVSPE